MQAVAIVGGLLTAAGAFLVAVVNRATTRDSKLTEQFDAYTKNLREDIASLKADRTADRAEMGRMQERIHTLEQELLNERRERLKVETERDGFFRLAEERQARIATLEGELKEAKAMTAALARRIASGKHEDAETVVVVPAAVLAAEPEGPTE